MGATMALAQETAEQHALDYDIDDVVIAESPEALKALVDPTRTIILDLLLERAATTTQLAAALAKPRGTIGYHLKVLDDAGLVKVVRTRPVRAMVEKYYGRTGRTIVYGGLPEGADKAFMLRRAVDEMVCIEGEDLPMFTTRRARIPEERAVEFAERVWALAEEFIAIPRSGRRVYGFVAGIYPTEMPSLSDEEET
jgi:DNA-binding transcriptional ArsR family regulator